MAVARKAYVGIDVAFAKRKRLPVSVCTLEDARLTPLALGRYSLYPPPPRGRGNVLALDADAVSGFANETLLYLREIERLAELEIQCVALDAPRSCSVVGRRACELAMDSLGISCFSTPTTAGFEEIRRKVREHLAGGGAENRLPHANQLWMLVGFALFEELGRVYECLEVFPQATVRTLRIETTHKSRREGLRLQHDVVGRRTGWPDGGALRDALQRAGYGAAHDRLDAFMCAWASSQWPAGLTAHGNPPDDVIWVPAGVEISSG